MRRVVVGLAAVSVLLGASGCGGSSSVTAVGGMTDAVTSSSSPAAVGLEVTSPWAKTPTGDMMGVFATVRNTGTAPVTLIGGMSADAGMVEIHETAIASDGTRQMQQKVGGLTIAPGGSAELVPGGDHIMLMALKRKPSAGDTVTVTLKTSAGDVTVTAEVRDFSGGDETYHSHS